MSGDLGRAVDMSGLSDAAKQWFRTEARKFQRGMTAGQGATWHKTADPAGAIDAPLGHTQYLRDLMPETLADQAVKEALDGITLWQVPNGLFEVYLGAELLGTLPEADLPDHEDDEV